MTENDSRPLFPALALAMLAIAARLPFLLTGKIPFDADEAVEGLMARHVLNGEWPAFFWGQAFKGVPEVYAAAGAFALFGSSVTALKSVTLAFFAAYVALTFVLLDKIASRWVASAASLLLIFAPPALVFWSLDASAEYIVLMLLGTMLLLLLERDRTGSGEQKAKSEQPKAKRALFTGLVIGLGLWVHQLFVIYLLPLVLIRTLRSRWWRRRHLGSPNWLTLIFGAIAALYVALGLIAFMTGGFTVQLGSLTIGARAPQKMLRIGAAAAALAGLTHVMAGTSREQKQDFARRWWTIAAGFVAGYSPVILHSVLIEPSRSPARVADLRDMITAAPDIVGNIVPILAGFKIATTERLQLPVIAAIPSGAALAAYLWSRRRQMTCEFFPLFVVLVPALFLASGAYLDTQSYRYLIPWYAGLSVAWAAGSLALTRKVPLASVMVAAIAAVHIWQQAIWFHKLAPDVQSVATIECLTRNGIRGGFAEYWTAYKLTFLSNETLIIAPTDGVDRYPKYTQFVNSLPAHLRVEDASKCQ